MNMIHLGRGAAAIVLPTFLFACGGSGGGSGSGGEPPASSQFSVVADNDTADANGINSIVHADDGTIYAIGFSNQADQRTVILSYNADGSVNSSFGDNGVLTLNVKQAGTGMGTVSSGDEQGFGIVELADGDLVFTATAADGNGTAEVDEGQSIYLFRLDADSNFDVVTDFGDDGGSNGLLAGAQEVVFSTPNSGNAAYLTAAGIYPTDFTSDLILDTSGGEERLVVFGGGSAPITEAATDQDRYVTRIMTDGLVDNGFNGGEAHQFSTPRNGNSGDNVRHGFVEEDGDIMSAGYTNLGDGLGNHIILIKLLEDGSQDMSFGDFIFPADGPSGIAEPGIAVFNPFRDAAGFAEAYGAVRQSNGDYITTGYGAANNGTVPDSGPFSVYAPNEQQDVVTFRVAGGTQLDTSYGNPEAGNGTQAIQSEDDDTFAGDVEADLLRPEERGRNLVILPDDRSIHVGYFGGVPALYLFTADGQLDTSMDDDGIFLLPHDDVDNSNGPVLQQFFAAELSADGSTLAVGTRATDDAGARVVVIDTGIE